MSKTVTIKRDSGIDEMLELLRGRRSMATIARFLIEGVNHGSQILQGRIVKDRFTGEGPFPVPQSRLGVVTGRLRRSIRFGKARFSAGVLKVSAGSNVKYFGKHEFGGGGRQVRVGAAKVQAHEVRNLFGRGKTVKVKAHTRKAYLRVDNTPARKPLQAGINEHGARTYSVTMEKALMKALEGRMS